MENASKALLIAGSVLIAILLIAVGMKIFNSTSGTTDATKSTMNATEVAIFNSKFNNYINKEKLTSADMRSLSQLIKANNATNSHEVTINIQDAEINQYKYFTITKMNYNPEYDEDGYLRKITFNRCV